MTVAIITGSAGLIGSEAAWHFGRLGLDVVGIDNDMRRTSSARTASTAWNRRRRPNELGDELHATSTIDIRDRDARDRAVRAVRQRHRAGHPHRGAAVARLGGARAVHRLRRQRRAAR